MCLALISQDMAVATGGTVFGEESSLVKIEDILLHDFGEAEEVTITKDDTLILRGKGKQEDLDKRIAQILEEIELSTSDYEKVCFKVGVGKLVLVIKLFSCTIH